MPGWMNARATGILCVLGAASLFTCNDVIIKYLSGNYALHQVILIRSSIAMALLLLVFVPLQGGYSVLRTRRFGMHVIRGFFVVITNMSFFAALAAMPLAEAVAVSFISPVLITAFSVVFLGEIVGPRRWFAVVVGLMGVLIILRPGTAAFQPVALLPLLAAVTYAGLNILARKIGATERATTMAFYIQLTFIATSGAMGVLFGDGAMSGNGHASIEFLFRAWVWPTGGDWPLLIVLGLFNGTAGVLIAQAYRLSEAAIVAPFEYAAVPLSVIMGLLVFGEWPDHITWAGIALIMGGGLYIFLREAWVNRPIPARRTTSIR